MIGVYLPGGSPLHRMPAGGKLLALLLTAVGLAVVGDPRAVAVAMVGTVGMVALARVPASVAFRQIRPVLWFVGPLLVLQWILAGPATAIVVVGNLIVVVALAALVTVTTRVSAMLDTFEAGLRPLRRFGVDPDRVGLILALAVRCVPLVVQAYHQVRQAQQARGTEREPLAVAVPLVIGLLKRADRIGEAMSARGLD